MTIEFVYFDLGNVLLNFDHRRGCRQMAAVAGVSAEQVWQVLFESGAQERYERGDLSSRQFYELFCEQTDCQTNGTRPDYNALKLAGSDIFSLKTEVLPILTGLSAAGRRIGLLSNTSPSHWGYCSRRFRVLDLFETVILSFEVGAMKPDAAIYEMAIERAGVPAESILFIDDMAENVEGARQAGLKAVQFTGALSLAAELRER